MSSTREIVQSILDHLVRLLVSVEVEGLENIPMQGGVMIAANHLSRMDAPILLTLPVKREVVALMAEKYEKHWFFGWFGRTMGFIFIDRSKADFSAFRTAASALKNGLLLAIAPEGTRSKDRRMLEGKPGVILLAHKTGVPIIPASVVGTDVMLKKIFTLQRPKVKVRIGTGFTIPPLERERRDEQLQEWTDELMCRIAVMLPEDYHGFYSNHPRLKALMAEQPQKG
ncbi:MAG: 1-acyl-sn-glycerol-3-phosphate acyltransferase [Anaerolineae bacterium]|nr:1-acyl-sn-glycerol-3-phosphate acyltransferase [Anaerolineae bacterium]